MKVYKILIAETAPVISAGLTECIGKLKDFHSNIIEAGNKVALFDILSTEIIDLLLVNPSFGGLMHPDDLRKGSSNPDIKIIAVEIGKLSRATINLFDGHFHVTDDLTEIKNIIMGALSIHDEEPEDKENLSAREKEIITYVVKGYTNQEIADHLFLSVHTVMTHRRNIARKLQIHSATGLTIYAIVNKLVDLSEIKL